MKKSMKKALYTASFLSAALLSSNAMAQANVANVTSSVTVNNSITAALGNTGLNFGVIALIPGVDGSAGGETNEDMGATATVSSAGVLSAAAIETGADGTDVQAVASVVDDTNAQAALINISDAVDTSTLNVTIDNVSVPTSGFNTLALDGFLTSYNGGTQSSARNLSGGSVSFTETFSSTFGGGTNTLAIGATITAAEGDTINETAPYTGSFDVTVSY